MANEIRVRTSVECINDNSVSNEGTAAGDYTHKALDAHAASRSWGGSYNVLPAAGTAYADTDICSWEGAVIDITSAAGGLGDSVWNEGNVAPVGTIPATAHVIAVEYTKTLGTVASVSVTVSGELFALLTLGESIVIPWHAGEATSSIGLTASAYSNGVHEATVNVMLAGVQ